VPKRRVTTAKQKAAAKANLEKARKRRKKPQGKLESLKGQAERARAKFVATGNHSYLKKAWSLESRRSVKPKKTRRR